MIITATVTSLHVYPVKSCRGLALEAARMSERGIAFDREWVIVDSGDHSSPSVDFRALRSRALAVPRMRWSSNSRAAGA